jgi:multidrug efflux pump subunit AcrA (membrane-fusion protein)
VAGAGGGAGQRRQGSVTVQVTKAVEGALAADRTAAAAVSTTTQSQVAALVSGAVRSVAHRPGDWVKEGEVVLQLDDAQLLIALANAQASLESAKINLAAVQDSTAQNNARLSLQVQSAQAACDAAQKYYDAQKALFDLGGISGSALDTANAQLASAKAALESAKIALDQNQRGVATTASQNVDVLRIAVATAQNNLEQARLNLRNAAIRAPFSGQISAINVAPGMYVGLNTAVFVLVSSERQVGFGISPQDAPALPAGAALRFEYAGSSMPLTVRQAPSAPVNGVVPMVAGGPGLGSLPFGVVGEVVYRVVLARGVIVPMSAIDTADNRNVVYVVEDGRVAVRPVTVVAESGSAAAVTGLGPGSLVIVSPPPGLVPGAQVKTVPATGVDLGPGTKAGRP